MSKGVAVLAWGIGGIVLPLLLVFVVTDLFRAQIVNTIYKNVEDISDNEMPSTVTSYQSGPEVVSTIGGGGEGLNCSLPRLANYFFDRMEYDKGNRRLVLQRFRQACVFHDLCYRHGLATYGYTQNDCDQVLQNEAFRLCKNVQSRSAESCQTDSKMILAGVTFGGSNAYRAWDRSTYFEFEADPSRSSGFSVEPGGRSSFQIGQSRTSTARTRIKSSSRSRISGPISPSGVSPARKYRSSRIPTIATTPVPSSARSV